MPLAHLSVRSESGKITQCGCRRKPEIASRKRGRGDPEPRDDLPKVRQSEVNPGSNPGFLKGNSVLFLQDHRTAGQSAARI